MHRITGLELLGTLIAVLEQKKANKEIVSPYIIQIFFLSQRKLIMQF